MDSFEAWGKRVIHSRAGMLATSNLGYGIIRDLGTYSADAFFRIFHRSYFHLLEATGRSFGGTNRFKPDSGQRGDVALRLAPLS